METVAFYSYKGGVGRSLLLANAARFLATLGKGVVALDFDFEAPGLHYKLGRGPRSKQRPTKRGGVVPYLLAAALEPGSPPPLRKHLLEVPVPPDSGGWLRLMPAGPAPEKAYWAALKELGDRLRFDDPNGQGVMALLDLQARIEEELKPDYLLIDARAGVTVLGSLATTLLADTVACLFVPNQESLDGTVAVAEALKAAPRLKGRGPRRVVPVHWGQMTEELSGEQRFTAGLERLLELGEGKTSLLHTKKGHFAVPQNETFAVGEWVVAGEKAAAFSSFGKTYLDLLQSLFPADANLARQVIEPAKAVGDRRRT